MATETDIRDCIQTIPYMPDHYLVPSMVEEAFELTWTEWMFARAHKWVVPSLEQECCEAGTTLMFDWRGSSYVVVAKR